MEIHFRSEGGDIQIIELTGHLSDTEIAAVKFKLDEKLNQGRAKVLLDLAKYPLDDPQAQKNIHNLISYCAARPVIVVASGVPAAQWPILILSNGFQIKIFITAEEALDSLAKTPALNLKPALPEKTEETISDDEIKKQALEKLLKSYEIFQKVDDHDPYRLDFWAQQYKTTKTLEALDVEKSARQRLSQLVEENKHIDARCASLAEQLKVLMQYRKEPVTPKELSMKTESLNEEINQAQEALEKAQALIAASQEAAQKEKKENQEGKASLEQSLQELEAKAQALEAAFKADQEAP